MRQKTSWIPSGSTIRTKRHELGLSQTKLAKAIGSHQSVITAYEREARVPTAEHVKLLCEVLQLEPEESLLPPATLGYCGNHICPNNIRGVVNGALRVIPVLVDGSKKYCEFCGEEIVTKICHGEITDELAIHCPICGEPYIIPGKKLATDPEIPPGGCAALLEKAHAIAAPDKRKD